MLSPLPFPQNMHKKAAKLYSDCAEYFRLTEKKEASLEAHQYGLFLSEIDQTMRNNFQEKMPFDNQGHFIKIIK